MKYLLALVLLCFPVAAQTAGALPALGDNPYCTETWDSGDMSSTNHSCPPGQVKTAACTDACLDAWAGDLNDCEADACSAWTDCWRDAFECIQGISASTPEELDAAFSACLETFDSCTTQVGVDRSQCGWDAAEDAFLCFDACCYIPHVGGGGNQLEIPNDLALAGLSPRYALGLVLHPTS